jgi:hypothetical protein
MGRLCLSSCLIGLTTGRISIKFGIGEFVFLVQKCLSDSCGLRPPYEDPTTDWGSCSTLCIVEFCISFLFLYSACMLSRIEVPYVRFLRLLYAVKRCYYSFRIEMYIHARFCQS